MQSAEPLNLLRSLQSGHICIQRGCRYPCANSISKLFRHADAEWQQIAIMYRNKPRTFETRSKLYIHRFQASFWKTKRFAGPERRHDQICPCASCQESAEFVRNQNTQSSIRSQFIQPWLPWSGFAIAEALKQMQILVEEQARISLLISREIGNRPKLIHDPFSLQSKSPH